MPITSKVTLGDFEAWGVYYIQPPNPAGTVVIKYYACGNDLGNSGNDTVVISEQNVTGVVSESNFSATCTADSTTLRSALRIESSSSGAATIIIRWWLVLEPVSWIINATDGTLEADIYIDKETETTFVSGSIGTSHYASVKKRMTIKVERIASN